MNIAREIRTGHRRTDHLPGLIRIALACIAALFTITFALAEPEEQVLQAVARRMQLTPHEVRRDYDASLIKAQPAWLAYRDTACDFEGKMGGGGGSIAGLYVLRCNEDLTNRQAERLEGVIRD